MSKHSSDVLAEIATKARLAMRKSHYGFPEEAKPYLTDIEDLLVEANKLLDKELAYKRNTRYYHGGEE